MSTKTQNRKTNDVDVLENNNVSVHEARVEETPVSIDIVKLDHGFLAKFSLSDLKDLNDKLHYVIEEKEKLRVNSAKEQIQKIAEDLGMDVETVLGLKKNGAKGKAEAVYQHPDNADLTWSSRGRKPNWLVEALNEGHNIDEFKVKTE